MVRKNTRVHILLAVAVLLLATAGCANSAGQPAPAAAPESVTLLNPLGPAVIPVTGLASGKVSGDVQVDLQYWKTTDEVTGLLSNGTAQFAVLPVTTGANMAAAGLDLVLLGVHEWKAFYLVAAEDAAFDDWDSLRAARQSTRRRPRARRWTSSPATPWPRTASSPIRM
jgi:NitT/TauT family transport system substrate-binding protein